MIIVITGVKYLFFSFPSLFNSLENVFIIHGPSPVRSRSDLWRLEIRCDGRGSWKNTCVSGTHSPFLPHFFSPWVPGTPEEATPVMSSSSFRCVGLIGDQDLGDRPDPDRLLVLCPSSHLRRVTPSRSSYWVWGEQGLRKFLPLRTKLSPWRLHG